MPDRVGPRGRDGGAGAQPEPSDPFAEAIELGLESLRECGIPVPAAGGFSAGLDDRFDRLFRWLHSTSPAEDLARPELRDPDLLAASRFIDAILPVAYFVSDPAMAAWLAIEAVRIWIEHGPSRLLLGPTAHAAYQAGPQRDDYHGAYRALQRIIALGEAREYEPGTSQARYMAASNGGWFEPIENRVQAAHRARDGLIAGGELAYGGYTYMLSVPYSVDCAPSLASLLAEIDGGVAFLRRTGTNRRAGGSTATSGSSACCAAKAPRRRAMRSRSRCTSTTRWR